MRPLLSIRCRKLSALFVLASVAACSTPLESPAPHPAQVPGPAVAHRGALKFKVFTAGQTPGFLASATAVDIAAGPGGYMWFTDISTPAIGRVAPDGTITEFTNGLPAGSRPYSILPGLDGNMWFSDNRGIAIGSVKPSGVITEYDTAQYDSAAAGIAFGPSGEPWIVGLGAQHLLAHLDKQATVETQLLPPGMNPVGALTSDSIGNLFFVAENAHKRGELIERVARSGKLRRIRLDMHGALTQCCPNAGAKSIVMGADGNPWFTTLDYAHGASSWRYLGTLSSGKVRLIHVKHGGLHETVYPSGLASTANGFWITGGDPLANNGALWNVRIDGKQTAYDLPYNPLSVAVDAGGNPWFTAIYSLVPSSIVEITSIPTL